MSHRSRPCSILLLSSILVVPAIAMAQDPPPDARFSFATDGLGVTFSDKSVGGPSSWLWNFGDGKTSSDRDPVHAYARAGVYSVRLTVSNESGEDSTSEFVDVTVKPPEANFAFSVSGLVVIFSDRSSGRPTSFTWDFGDGASSQDRNPIHTYAAGGEYPVTLTVANDAGESGSSQFVFVVPGGPSAAFEFAVADLTAIFKDTSKGVVTERKWEFGDGASSNERNPVHVYAEPGTYVVTLTVSNARGQQDSASDFVFAKSP